jgi:hypothetical protein
MKYRFAKGAPTAETAIGLGGHIGHGRGLSGWFMPAAALADSTRCCGKGRPGAVAGALCAFAFRRPASIR